MKLLLPLGLLLFILALGPSCGEDVLGPMALDSASKDFTVEIECFARGISASDIDGLVS